MSDLGEQPPEVSPVSADEVHQALALVAGWLPREQRAGYVRSLAGEIREGAISTEGLLLARRAGRPVGALWVQVQPGRTALVWPPRLVPGEPTATAECLFRAAGELLGTKDLCLATALVSAVTAEEDRLLRGAGFEPLASLLYLVSAESDFPPGPPGGPLQYEPYANTQQDRLARLVEATYVGTRDCPALNGLRSIEDVLAGYRGAGVFLPEGWLFVRHEGRDAGCLLLADHPRDGNVELVYMGLIPSERGKGLGEQVCRHAQWLTRRMGRARLVLAVDATNEPALAMYAAVGFRVWDRRNVYLKRFGRATGARSPGQADFPARTRRVRGSNNESRSGP